jgi:hypothetical protein
METYDSTVTFSNRRHADRFAELFAETFNHGYDMGFEKDDKSVDVKIYGISKSQKEWISKLNGF